ncbi:aromatic amino acid ammonia-lyase [Sphaerisporangium siamense]|uniref:Histidine ammonia-lyase n=1 Tax=Sphaerisporangium siamense TaxID=795645 RepID=A0A7W7DCF7_9ACTN|nr:aromatic amino acid ammonia-lyase [Sphaerisporangium siamense]MBB4703131.1 histidine ammonia-lyase [Sphaerisporangium siamense]
MASPIVLDGVRARPGDIAEIARAGARVALAGTGLDRARASHAAARAIAARRPVYGRTTGVGANRTEAVPAAERDLHGLRLLRSHAGGAGPPEPDVHVRAMLAVRVNQILAGGSGLRPAFAEALAEALNAGRLPEVRQVGAIGTGDLTALAETGLTLVGERPWQRAGEGAPPAPLTLEPGDALAFCSSGAMTIGQAALAWALLSPLLRAAQVVAALSLVAVDGSTEPYDAEVHAARPHPGGAAVAAEMRRLLHGAQGGSAQGAREQATTDETSATDHSDTTRSHKITATDHSSATRFHEPSVSDRSGARRSNEIIAAGAARVQDPFGFRCLPQAHGPGVEAAGEVERVVAVEINAAAENPLVPGTGGTVHHHGGFHQAALGLALDHLRLALLPSAHLSAARLATLMDPAYTGLRRFLADGAPGASGAMILEYSATSALAGLREAAHPASLGHAVLSLGAEDHASFAPQSARQTLRAASAYRLVLACELVTAVRALRMRGVVPDPSTPVGAAFAEAAGRLDPATEDRPLGADADTAADLLDRLAGL